jgi:hypothetical protein
VPLLRFAFHRFANCDQEDGSLACCVRRKEVDHVIIKKRQPGHTQALSIRGQVHPAADGARFQLDGAVRQMRRYAVSPRINNVANDDLQCSQPIEVSPAIQAGLF